MPSDELEGEYECFNEIIVLSEGMNHNIVLSGMHLLIVQHYNYIRRTMQSRAQSCEVICMM